MSNGCFPTAEPDLIARFAKAVGDLMPKEQTASECTAKSTRLGGCR